MFSEDKESSLAVVPRNKRVYRIWYIVDYVEKKVG